MRSSILKYLDVLKDHHITTQGVGARHKEMHTHLEGGRYLDNYTKLELSLSASELDAVFDCLTLPSHWAKIQQHVGSLKFLELWRALDTLRTDHRLRIQVGKLSQRHIDMSGDEFELWLDAQRLAKPWFEIYVATAPEQYRFIWQTLYTAANRAGRKHLRIYVPHFNTWNNHLKNVLLYNLLDGGVANYDIPKHIQNWTGQTICTTSIQKASKAISLVGPSFLRCKTCEIAL